MRFFFPLLLITHVQYITLPLVVVGAVLSRADQTKGNAGCEETKINKIKITQKGFGHHLPSSVGGTNGKSPLSSGLNWAV
jgi:hypothetical protein